MTNEDSTLDFDAFWSAHQQDKSTSFLKPLKLFGEMYYLNMDVEFRKLNELTTTDIQDEGKMSQLVDDIYGPGVYQIWISKGLTLNQLPILLAWSLATIQGRDVTFEQVAKEVETVFSSGKAPTPLNGTGQRLKPTSQSTATRKRKN